MTELLNAESPAPVLNAHRCGAGEDLLLVHGGMGSWNHWARNVEALGRHFRVHAIDLPGYGQSPRVDKSLSADEYKALVLRAVQTMFPGDTPLRIAGFSFGGALSSHLAARLGPRVKGLSIIGASGFGKPEGRVVRTRSYKGVKDDPEAYREVVRNNLLAFMLNDPEMADEQAVAFHGGNVKRAGYDSRRVSWGDSQRFDLARVTCPVQAIWGENDVTAYPSIDYRVKILHEAAKNLRVDIIPGSAHWSMYDAAEAVNRLLIEFHTAGG